MRTPEIEKEIQDKAEEFQKECHAEVDKIVALKPGVSYQDVTNVWMFRKLAELDLRIQNINKNFYH